MRRSREQQRMWRLAARYSAVGIEIAVAVAVSSLAGAWLDRRFDTEPWLFLFGMIVGLGAATRAVVRVVRTTRFDKL